MAEVFEVRCRYRNTNTLPVQCAENTLYLLAPAGVGSLTQLAETVRLAWQPIVWELSADVEWEGVTIVRREPWGGALVNIEFAPHVEGRQIGQTLPTGVAVEALRRTGIRGPQYNGRLFLPWTLMNMADPDYDNRVAEDVAAGIEDHLNGTLVAFGGGTTTGLLLVPVVYSRRSASGIHHWTPITHYDVVRPYRNLTKRGRRAVECRPFDPTPISDGGLAIDTALLPFGWNGSHLPSGSGAWRFLETRFGNPLPAEPVGWQEPGFDDSGWSHFPAIVGMGDQPPEPYTIGFTTACLAQSPNMPGITNPPDWSAAPRHDLPWARESPAFRGLYWVAADAGHIDMDTWPDLGDAYMRCRFSDVATGPIVAAQLELYAVDSAEVWIDGESVINQADDERYSGHLAYWDYVPVGDRLGPGEHVLAIHVRARRHYHDPLCPGASLPHTGGRRFEHLYGDCHTIDFLCGRDTVFGLSYDHYWGLAQGCGLRLWTESVAPGTPVIEY